MRALIQRVSQANVEVEEKVVGKINHGVIVFLGIAHNDTKNHAVWLINKLINLRIFEDSLGKINRSLLDTQGEVLIISQFTLYADCNEGRRPSFTQAAQPEVAKQLYAFFVEEVRKTGVLTATGIFGAYMKVNLSNDGPFTILLER